MKSCFNYLTDLIDYVTIWCLYIISTQPKKSHSYKPTCSKTIENSKPDFRWFIIKYTELFIGWSKITECSWTFLFYSICKKFLGPTFSRPLQPPNNNNNPIFILAQITDSMVHCFVVLMNYLQSHHSSLLFFSSLLLLKCIALILITSYSAYIRKSSISTYKEFWNVRILKMLELAEFVRWFCKILETLKTSCFIFRVPRVIRSSNSIHRRPSIHSIDVQWWIESWEAIFYCPVILFYSFSCLYSNTFQSFENHQGKDSSRMFWTGRSERWELGRKRDVRI